ncbi:hypothetical protein RL72_02397 [Microbacterium azadirachtae]|uniref:Uncharacterized protein n=2 Tax=Microbacterium azadirachtae TaxID=582680 RepID=A0A0F0KLX2_9MICO|nr:hypothetical protein RL72_02397 [Microbacterium azadirachtae]SDL60906.1 hypothetical protein SAMN04488593_1307 [Microbacterium azadirachtae]SEF89800.1 hypothetical protein SAMN04488594_1294 [Microbacterium azadirachtae]SEF91696.1 hypothetical protein SAMN04488592_1304 [Microbacterium azadirachtae]
MFTQKPQEPSAWAALPGEPLDRDDDLLPEPAADPFGIGLGATTSATSVAIPLPPEAGAVDGEPASEGQPR